MQLAFLQNVSKLYGAQTVLRDVSFRISSGQKLGLIGPNGSGKTTILRILLGHEDPTGGTAVLTKGVSVGYVPQYVEYDDNETALDCVLSEYNHLAAELREKEELLAETSGKALHKALRAYQRVRDAYDLIEGDDFPRRARAMLDALGLVGRGEQLVGSLSGGEKNVLSMAKVLLSRPDLLILDEPANHLDYMGIAWLEDFLNKFSGAVLIVSHNRYLLDRVVGGILELSDGKITSYAGNYSEYKATRLRALIAQQSDYIANQKRLAQLEALVRKFADIARGHTDPKWGKRLRARRSQLKREKKQAVEKPTLGQSAMRPDFSTEATRANIALQVRGYSKAFGDLKLLESADLDISCGERVALVGPNGSGKTTLLRDVVEHGDWGNPMIRVGPSISVGYCAQEQECLQSDGVVLDEITSAVRITRQDALGVLARFLFDYDDVRKRVADLSGGERNRLQLARLMVMKPNFLILDEPTNHLDIPSREAVEEALAEFEGTLLVVSHDRYFLDKVVKRVVEVRDRGLASYPGNFTDFWYARKRPQPRAAGRIAKRRKARERPSPKRAAEESVAALEKRIAEAERRKLALEQRMTDAFTRRDHREGGRAGKQLERLKAQLDDLYEKWLEVSS
jgi:ATP-binding cassette subfamily F protein 3